MDIKAMLESEHSRPMSLKIAGFIGDDVHLFKSLMNLVLSGEKLYSQRASWAMRFCYEAHPHLITPYISSLIDILEIEDLHDGVKRNTLSILEELNITEDLEGLAYDNCYKILSANHQPVALKAYSMTIIEKIAVKHPELMEELVELIKLQIPYESAGYKSRGNKILKKYAHR